MRAAWPATRLRSLAERARRLAQLGRCGGCGRHGATTVDGKTRRWARRQLASALHHAQRRRDSGEVEHAADGYLRAVPRPRTSRFVNSLACAYARARAPSVRFRAWIRGSSGEWRLAHAAQLSVPVSNLVHASPLHLLLHTDNAGQRPRWLRRARRRCASQQQVQRCSACCGGGVARRGREHRWVHARARFSAPWRKVVAPPRTCWARDRVSACAHASFCTA